MASSVRRWPAWAIIMIVSCAAFHAGAQVQPANGADAGRVSEWAQGNRILLGVTQEKLGFAAQWRFERAGNGDIFLEKQENRAGRMEAGALLLIDSGALLARDMRLEPGKELDAINGPLLMLQLVLRLLERAVPGGPSAITKDMQVDISERSRSLVVTGIGADGEFVAPWTLRGTVGPAGKGSVKLQLEFVSSVPRQANLRYETSIAGVWQNSAPAIVFPDAMGLRDWQVYRIKPVVKPRGAMNVVGLGTTAPMGFRNLGEVRRHVAEWTNESARRSRWQCN